MLAVMKFERLGRHDRREGILGEGQFGQLEGHDRGQLLELSGNAVAAANPDR